MVLQSTTADGCKKLYEKSSMDISKMNKILSDLERAAVNNRRSIGIEEILSELERNLLTARGFTVEPAGSLAQQKDGVNYFISF